MNVRLRIGAVLLTIATLHLAAVAQNAPAASNSDARLITVRATVTEPRNRFVVGLEKEDFQLLEDDIAQTIVSVTPAANSPGEYVLTFRSSNTATDGAFRAIQVKVNTPKGQNLTLVVRATAGYFAPSGTPSGNGADAKN